MSLFLRNRAIGLIYALTITCLTNSAAMCAEPAVRVGDQVTIIVEGAELRDAETVLARLSKGQQFEVVEVKGSWVLLATEQDGEANSGWVLAKQLKVLTESTPDPASTAIPDDLKALDAKVELNKAGEVIGVIWASSDTQRMVDTSVLARYPKLRRLQLLNPLEAGLSLEPLSKLPELEALHLMGPEIADETISQLVKLPHLKEVSLYFTSVTDSGLEKVTLLEGLERLDLSRDMGYNFARRIVGMFLAAEPEGVERSESLYKSSMRVGLMNASLRYMFNGNKVTEQGLAHLASSKSLRSVNLAGFSLTNEGCEHLSAIPHLEQLNLFGAGRISDTGIRHFKENKKLKLLVLPYPFEGDDVYSEQGAADLQKALPNCVIVHTFNYMELLKDEKALLKFMNVDETE